MIDYSTKLLLRVVAQEMR